MAGWQCWAQSSLNTLFPLHQDSSYRVKGSLPCALRAPARSSAPRTHHWHFSLQLSTGWSSSFVSIAVIKNLEKSNFEGERVYSVCISRLESTIVGQPVTSTIKNTGSMNVCSLLYPFTYNSGPRPRQYPLSGCVFSHQFIIKTLPETRPRANLVYITPH